MSSFVDFLIKVHEPRQSLIAALKKFLQMAESLLSGLDSVSQMLLQTVENSSRISGLAKLHLVYLEDRTRSHRTDIKEE